jgi:hypothetical protein
MVTLMTKGVYDFNVTSDYHSQFMIPILENTIVKAREDWDDYHEAFHFTKLVNETRQNKKVTVEYHSIMNKGTCVGIAMIRYGSSKANDVSLPSNIGIKENSIVLNYFHIAPEARGNGTYWLKEIILPYYKKQGFTYAYIKSSHSKVFSLYERLGLEIDEYYTYSDNYLYERKGKVFVITL